MFSMQERISLSRTVLLTLFLEFTFVDKSTSNQGACEGINERSKAYFYVGTEEVDLNTAWQLCNYLNSSLPVICNQNEQNVLTIYLQTHVRSSAIWTSGRKITFDKWTWTNGQPFENSDNISVGHHTYTHGVLGQNRFYKAGDPGNPQSKNYYICQYSAMLAADSNDEIKYSNWANDYYSLRGECISIVASNGEWKAVGCTDKKKAICQRNLRSTSVQSAASSSTSSMTSCTMSSLTDTTTESQVLIYSGVSAGIVIIIICIIVMIIAIRSTKKSAKNMDQSKANNNSEQNRLQESPNEPANAPAKASANAPVSAPVKGADDFRGVYAEIPLASVNKSEDNATNQQPGIVYASLEFQKEPTYAEPNMKRDNPTSPTKVGPLGDTYAIPDAKGYTVTSPGTSSGGSSSHPIVVSAQGDVYALPVKNSMSPNANSPGGNVYANLK